MTRGDDTAAAHIPTQPSASDDSAGFASTSGPPDDFVDTDAAPARVARRGPVAEPETDPAADTDLAIGGDAAPARPARRSATAEPETDQAADTDIAPAAQPPAEGSGLDDRSKEILAFERRWWRQAGSKEQAVRDTFGLSATRYYQLLNALLDNPAALAHEPVVVQRLRRLRASRIRTRGSARRQ
jgi:hypothetical protein